MPVETQLFKLAQGRVYGHEILQICDAFRDASGTLVFTIYFS